jgi:transposase
MKDWFDYRHERAVRFREDGWSMEELQAHFGVPIKIVRIWLEGPRKKARKPRHHAGYRTTGQSQQNNSEHLARIAAHKARIQQESTP